MYSLEQGKVQVEEDEGLPTHQMPSYLNEFMWQKRYGQSKRMAFNSIMRDVDQQYLYRRGVSNTSPTVFFLFFSKLPLYLFIFLEPQIYFFKATPHTKDFGKQRGWFHQKQ